MSRIYSHSNTNMKHQLDFRPVQRPLFAAVQTQEPRIVRDSLRRVLYDKFLAWLRKSSASSLMKATLKCLIAAALCLMIFARDFALGMLTDALDLPIVQRVMIYCVMLLLTLNVHRLFRLARRVYVKHTRKTGNQYTYEGIALDELATYLTEKGFTTAAMQDLALSQRKWAKIADTLEGAGILVRGENNARVLGQIDRATLVRQLREGFPLVFDPVGKIWCEKRGSFDRYLLDKERKEAREKERLDRLQRKEGRMRKNIADMQSNGFQSVLALAQQ